MPDSPDDFDQSNVGEFTATLDSAELAARLYSPTIFARTGQIIYATDFSRGFTGLVDESTPGVSSIDIATLFPSIGGLSMELANNSSIYGNCNLALQLPYIKARYYTFDVGYYFDNSPDVFVFELQVKYEGTRHLVEFYHEFEPFEARLLNNDGDEEDVTALESSDSYFGNNSHVRITIDTYTGLYDILQVNSVKFNVNNIEYNQSNGSYPNEIYFYAYFGSKNNLAHKGYLRWIVLSVSDTKQ